MSAKTEVIQWYTPEEKKPETNDLIISVIYESGTYDECLFQDGKFWEVDDQINLTKWVKYWSYLPKGPEVETKIE